MSLRRIRWTNAELEQSILTLCDEIPDATMAVYSRALEYCRRVTPHGTAASLLVAMRHELRQEVELDRTFHVQAA